jgi:hypothetical protein
LLAGERLATLAGPTAVLGIKPQHKPQTVYNLEVQGQHVFRVTSNGLLVHNAYADEIAKLADDTAKKIFGKAPRGTKPLRRPYKRKEFRKQVESAAPRTPDGRPIDPNLKTPIDGKPHFGHVYGKEHRRLLKEAEAMGMNQKQFNEWINSHPEWFQLEDPISNMSHFFEKRGGG